MSEASASETQKLPALRFEIEIPATTSLKSLESLIWDDVPEFVVLTGVNGSGKTQLLELLANKIAGVPTCSLGNISQVKLQIVGDDVGPESIAYVPGRWDFNGAPSANLAEIQNAKNQLWSQVERHQVQHDPARRSLRARIEKLLGPGFERMGQEEFSKRLPDDLSFMLDVRDFTSGLAHVFLAYRLRLAQALIGGRALEDATKQLGPAPWDLLNSALDVGGFHFRIESPPESFLEPVNLRLRSTTSQICLWPSELSSGEQVILGTLTWLYRSNHHGGLPKLFLLDEPDAHLHPTLTRQLIEVLHNVLVKRHGVRVIMTTHSPSTVALAPEGSLFEMRRRDRPPNLARISRADSKAEVIAGLTSGLVVVSPGTRHVLVEDQDDVKFFEAIREVLTDYGPTRDPGSLAPTPTVAFMAASLGTGKVKIAGGKSVVEQWLGKLDEPPLAEIFRGIIDRDTGSVGDARLKVLSRYSIENYLLDPLVVFVALVDLERAPLIENAPSAKGTEHLVRTSENIVLQRIVDEIVKSVEPHLDRLSATEQEKRVVEFTTGVAIKYPAWILDRRGHDLLPKFQAVFGGAGLLTPPRLIGAIKRLRLMWSDLAQLMRALQS